MAKELEVIIVKLVEVEIARSKGLLGSPSRRLVGHRRVSLRAGSAA
jgi:hypothetical protein